MFEFLKGQWIVNFIMRSKNKLHQNPEIDLSFTKKNGELQKQQFRLSVQILRVHSIEKLRTMQLIWNQSQNQLCDFFTRYDPFPQQNFALQALLQSSKLKLVKSDNKIYFGQVDRKRRQGKGIYVQRDGKLYQGQFYNNQKNGAGIEIYSNGNLYIGNFLNNKKHGRGIFYWFSLSSRNPKSDENVEYYEGEWWGGLPDGYGVHQKLNGDLFTGVLKNGLKHGQGVQHYGNGDYYKGQYVNGMPQGFGEYIWGDSSAYKGDFKQGQRSGYGVWQANKNRIEGYKGHYNNDKKNGYGVYTWDNGWKYKGNFDNDYRNGYGQLFDSENELQYKGFWDNGEQTDRDMMIGGRGQDMMFNYRSAQNFKSKRDYYNQQDNQNLFNKESNNIFARDRPDDQNYRSRENQKISFSKGDIFEYATASNFGQFNLTKRPQQNFRQTNPSIKRSMTAAKNIRVRDGKIGTSINRPIMIGNSSSHRLSHHK